MSGNVAIKWGIAVALLVAGMYLLIDAKSETWMGYFFGEGCADSSQSCLAKRVTSPVFSSEKRCMDWGIAEMKSHSHPADTFSCEKDCRFVAGQSKCELIIQSQRSTEN
jgi:hypothetical protein